MGMFFLTSFLLTGGLSVPVQIPLSGTPCHCLWGTLSACIPIIGTQRLVFVRAW